MKISRDGRGPRARLSGMSSHVLVTGGAGFVGSHLVRALLRQGDRVTVLDDLSAPSPLGLPDDTRLERQLGDVRDPAAVARALDRRPTHVVHLAAVVGVERVVARPERVDSVIRDGGGVVLEAARRHGLPLLSVSTSEVTDAPREGPRRVYAEAKADAERAALAADELPVTVVRPFNVVGAGQTAPGAVLPRLAAQARRGAPLSVHGDGSQERGFLHVDDLVEAITALLAQTGAQRGLVEVGQPVRTRILDLARRLAGLAGRGSAVQLVDADVGREDRPRRAPDLRALGERVSWAPRRPLESILRGALLGA